MNRTALILAAVAVTFMIISNTVADGTTFGGIAFFVWAFAVLALVGLGVRSLVARNQRI
jgi:heme exporter protein D